MFMNLFIKLVMIIHPEQQQDGTGHAKGETKNINNGNTFVLPDIADYQFKAYCKHMIRIWDSFLGLRKACQQT